MIDAVALGGDEARVAAALTGLFALGATEILVSPVPVGDDRAASLERTLRLLSQVAQAVEACALRLSVASLASGGSG